MTTVTSAYAGMHFAMYLRQSLDREGNEIKVTTQRNDLTGLLHELGATGDEFVDNDTSATSRMPGSRKKAKARGGDYREMVQHIEAGNARTAAKYDGIAVSKSDRLYREPRQLEDLIDLVDGKDLAIVTAGSGTLDLSTVEGRAMARVTVTFARMEMEQKSARQNGRVDVWRKTMGDRGGRVARLGSPTLIR